MNEKVLYAPQIDYYIRAYGTTGFDSNARTYDAKTYKIVDEIFNLIRKIAPINDNGCRELWVCAERGPIDAFGSYEEYLEDGEVENREEFEQLWLDYYPSETKWYNLLTIEHSDTGYKAIIMQNKTIVEINPEYEKGYEYDISAFAKWVYETCKKCIADLKAGTYMDYVKTHLPDIHKTGTILQSELWELYPEDKVAFFEGLTDNDISEILSALEIQQENNSKPIGRLKGITVNDFYMYCSIGYNAMGYNIENLSPKQQYTKFADGRDGGLSEINPDSEEEFNSWLRDSFRHGAHPWEVCRGGNSTHISLSVYGDNTGLFLCLSGSSYIRTNETLKFYLSLVREGIPVYLKDGDILMNRLKGTEKVGVVPQGTIPKYRHSDFPNENIISFMNLPYEDTDKVASRCVWQELDEVRLLPEEE